MKALQHPYAAERFTLEKRPAFLFRFFNWCSGQEENRLLWLGFIVCGHGCVFTPVTLFLIMFSGNNPVLWPFAIAAITMALVSNLAAMPAKVTIPIFFLSLLIDGVIIGSCFATGLSFPSGLG